CEFPSEGDGLLVTTRLPTPLTPLPEHSSPAPATSTAPTPPKPQNQGKDNQEAEKLSEKGALPNMTDIGKSMLQPAKHKRKSQADDGSVWPTKRSRDDPSSEAQPTSDLFGKSPKAVLKKRYGRKARTSSPALSDSESEYEEIPAPRSRKAPVPAKHAKRGKVATMKAKTNRKQVTTVECKEPLNEEKASNRETKKPIEMSSDIDEYDLHDRKMDDKGL
ncbi:hypothetical protein MPER_00871, partial [Moniliophthora perniciosa FA553]